MKKKLHGEKTILGVNYIRKKIYGRLITWKKDYTKRWESNYARKK